jgi:HEAT repeat protein
VQSLAIVLKDSDASVRATAVDALGEIGGDAARSLLESALEDESELVREMAAAQLEHVAN